MAPQPVHPDDIKPLGGGIRQRFVKSRFGWHVHTTHNCFVVERVPFAFTRTGIEFKADRLRGRLLRGGAPETFERTYDAPPPPGPAPTRPSPMQGETGKCPPAPGAAPADLGHRERTPR